MDVGGKALRALCAGQDLSTYVEAKLSDEYFYSDDEKKLYSFVAAHVATYSSLPQVGTLLEAFPELPEASEPVGYYLDKVDERFTYKTLNMGLSNAQELMKEQKLPATIELLGGLYSRLVQTNARHQMVEFSQEAYDVVMAEYAKASSGQMGVEFGWPYLDDMTGGMYPGDIVCYVGRPAMGKTYKMLYSAHDAWWRQEKDVLFVSMEMVPIPLIQRPFSPQPAWQDAAG